MTERKEFFVVYENGHLAKRFNRFSDAIVFVCRSLSYCFGWNDYEIVMEASND